MAWIDNLAAALGAEPLTDDEVEELLTVARDVAHGVERKMTPLATYLLGMDVARRIAAGEERAAAMRAAISELRATFPS